MSASSLESVVCLVEGCDFEHANRSGVSQHVFALHPPCPRCPRRFLDAEALEQHRREAKHRPTPIDKLLSEWEREAAKFERMAQDYHDKTEGAASGRLIALGSEIAFRVCIKQLATVWNERPMTALRYRAEAE